MNLKQIKPLIIPIQDSTFRMYREHLLELSMAFICKAMKTEEEKI